MLVSLIVVFFPYLFFVLFCIIMFGCGILGINARNLNYIKKFNPKKQIKLANNKIRTKNFLGERGIPVAKTYGVIRSHKELLNYDFGYLPHDSFVLKPNKGSKGKGIFVVNREEIDEKSFSQNKKINKKKSRWNYFGFAKHHIQVSEFPYIYHTKGTTYTDMEFKRILLDTLDGKNSTSVLKDTILIEEKLHPSKDFALYCQEGLADIRIIIFNLVPIAAMLRIPTKKSGGKANLAEGGIALGIDISSGQVKYEEQYIKKNFSDQYHLFKQRKIPYWDEILLLSSRIQYFVNLGYLALDWVITPDGPKLLEINGRAGLEIQNIAHIQLKNALKKVAGLKITTPEKGIEIAKALFSNKKTQIGKEKILYLSQMGKLSIQNTEEEDIDVIVKLNIHSKNNYISSQMLKKIGKNKVILHLEENAIHFKNLTFLADDELKKNEIYIGRKTSEYYFIKPVYKVKKMREIINPEYFIEEERELLLQFDKVIHMIGNKLILSSLLKPLNYLNELDIFITKKGKYNPQFAYKWPQIEVLHAQKSNILKYKKKLEDEIHSPIKKIFIDKCEELLYRVNLIEAYRKQNFNEILLYNTKLFGEISQEYIGIAKSKSFEIESDVKNLGNYLTLSQIRKKVETLLSEKGFAQTDIIVSSTNLSRLSVVKGKIPKIKILEGAKIRTLELKSVLAHEIDTHLTRYIHGQETERKIFQDGTGFYLRDEEGLAVYNAFQEADKIQFYKNTIYKNYFLTNEAQKYSFEKMFDLVKFLYNGQNMEQIFRKTMRLKRGIEDTSVINPGAIFLKDKIYLDGYEYVKKQILILKEQDIPTDKLYKGKYKFSELKYII